ncbi:MAG: AbrB/MazE/SpoVT family DNA-binding domain-containing protein [Propionibacteriaceae bacterium]|jgi:bifunctional DNA-binding transcriptional regulator/antitoxin component of YhaV-PrlF toxin-antitoxin module|nr:AbrB/MazE/SpoVT family DNA-binding domain-containing protein [Propionibacteriaceae bacterium]
MLTTMDKAGRVVIPRSVRRAAGLVPGPVDITADGAGVRIDVPTESRLVEVDGRLLLHSGPDWSADEWREFRLADQF